MTIEKKIFAFIADFDGQILPGKKWFVCYRTPDYKTGDLKKVKYYGDINKLNTVPERYKECEKIKQLILENKKLPDRKERRLQKTETDRNFASVIHLLLLVLNERKVDIGSVTYNNYKSMINALDLWLEKQNLKDITIVNFNEEIAREFLQYMKEDGKANKTHNNYKTIYSSLWKDIARKLKNHLKLENPWKDIKSLKKKTQPFAVYTPAIEKIVVKHLPAYNKQLWLYILFTHYGFIRGTENRKLRISNIDFENRTITITSKVSKTDEQRIITIPDHLYDELIQYNLRDYPSNYFIFSAKGFPSDKPAGKNYFTTKWDKFRLAFNIPNEYKIYPFKHTGMIKANKSGIDVKEIQMQTGQHSLDQVDEYLAMMNTDHLNNLRDNFPKLGELPTKTNANEDIKGMLLQILQKMEKNVPIV